jgi:hypothetical protein
MPTEIVIAQGNQQKIGVRCGRPEKTSITFIVCSLSSSDITIVVDGQVHTVPVSAIGTDQPVVRAQAGYIGNVMIGGLSPYTKYTYKVYQDDFIVSNDDKGKPFYFWTAPELDDDFIVVPVTCDNNTSLTNGTAVVGSWAEIRKIAEANPSKGVYIMHVDDILGYNDAYAMDDGQADYVSSELSGASYGGWEYDYALGAMSAYGLYDSSSATPTWAEYIEWGQQADRVWCYRNCPMLPQKGDHDSGHNEMSWDIDRTDNVTLIDGKTVTAFKDYEGSLPVYDAFLKPLQGASIRNADVNANHWHHTLGCLKIISMEAMTNGSGDAVDGVSPTRPTNIFGANQVSDSIDQCDVVIPFKMLPFANGIRYVADLFGGDAHKNQLGSQNPFGDNPSIAGGIPAHAEYRQLFTNAGGLMDLDNTNGVNGVMFTVHGDWHSAKVQRNQSTTGVNNEDFYSINVGTVNGSVNFAGELIPLATFDGSTVEMSAGAQQFGNEWWYTPMYVYGSRPTKEIEVEFKDMNGNMLWNKKFVEGNNVAQEI